MVFFLYTWTCIDHLFHHPSNRKILCSHVLSCWWSFYRTKAYLVRLPCLAKAGGSMRPLFFAFFSVFKMATKLLKAKFMPVQKLGEKCFSFNIPFYQLKRRKNCPLINECERWEWMWPDSFPVLALTIFSPSHNQTLYLGYFEDFFRSQL